MSLGIIIVDHGSRSSESNRQLRDVVDAFVRTFDELYPIVEAAHMELAEPSIDDAFRHCVARGAEEIVVCPFFLAPGKHMREDIPRLAAEAAARYAVKRHTIAGPLGLDELIVRLLEKRIREAADAPREAAHAV
jgi:sirohydrochlorin ferrochelatase